MSNLKNEAEETAKLIAFLSDHHETIVEEWFGSALLSPADPFYKEIEHNGRHTLLALTAYLHSNELEMTDRLTRKIAQERIEAEANIGDFVFNINKGRKIVTELVFCSLLSEHEKGKGIMKINDFFDQLLYMAVKEFSRLKDEIIKSKNQFIQEMHHDRLTMLGQIAASFAHEFRNPLTSIKGFIYLLQKEQPFPEKSSHYFEIIQNEMESLEDKVTQFLYLSKMKNLEDRVRPFHLSQIVHEMVDFMYPRFSESNIVHSIVITPGIWVEGDPSQIKQVLLNILNNAVEELCHIQGERRINVHLTKDEAQCEVKIVNNGEQIPAYMLENIFEPFVTTKSLGTGLGLSVCKQIVEKHSGQIIVDSNNKETAFLIKLPYMAK
ncbi:histidine kinase N-terminal domain-containing protein [Fictibacillus aquaticus]|uniref:histidine kinase n=1 Tax=Fictibacillus aquaticus TaxID=2021314 RepID=A0A235FCP2_9BACL|nr:histidine kinase N-terminal domain-containing protein [Fictibacillus aquaticus]OYD59096.1 hypothetical protein CGZ90_04120 [Fictibacillus aquaticus]